MLTFALAVGAVGSASRAGLRGRVTI